MKKKKASAKRVTRVTKAKPAAKQIVAKKPTTKSVAKKKPTKRKVASAPAINKAVVGKTVTVKMTGNRNSDMRRPIKAISKLYHKKPTTPSVVKKPASKKRGIR